MTEPQVVTEPRRPPSHRRLSVLTPRWLAAGGAVALAAVVGLTLLLQNGGSACAAPPSTSANSGKATFYDLGRGIGNCSYPSAPSDDLFVALGPDQYSGSAACGTYLDVTGPKGKVRVKVLDSCPECAAGHLDLSRTAFEKIADEVQGIVPITYRTVDNPAVPGPLTVRIKEGSSQYWFSALIDNHGNQLTSVKVAGPGGTFHTATRSDDNHWVIESGAGSGPYKLKITDLSGRTATVAGITMSPGRTQKASARLAGGVAGPIKPPPPASPAPAGKKPATAEPSASSAARSTSDALVESTTATETTAPAETSVDLAAATPARCG